MNPACKSNAQLTELLIKSGAMDQQGKTRTLEMAENIEVAQCLIDHGAKVDTNILSKNIAWRNNVELLYFLIKHGADVDIKVNIKPLFYDKTLLRCAENIEVAQHLIDLGVKIDQDILFKNEACGSDVTLTELFLNHGADLKVDWNYVKDIKVAQLLIDRGVRVDLDVLLYNQACYKNLELTKLFITNGADVNARDGRTNFDGNTPLHYAQTPEIVHCLLYHGADPKITNDYNKTCKDIWTKSRFNFKDLDNLSNLQESQKIRKGNLKIVKLYELFRPDFDWRDSLFAEIFLKAYLHAVQGSPEILDHIMLEAQEKTLTQGKIEAMFVPGTLEQVVFPELSTSVQAKLKSQQESNACEIKIG